MSDFSDIPTAYPQATGFDSIYVAEIATIDTLNMEGPLTLAFDATLPLEAVTLRQLGGTGGPFLPLNGGGMVTGATTFNPSVAAVGSANTVTLAGAATTAPGTLTMTGSDANISLRLVTKGTGTLQTGRMDVASNTNGQGVFDGSTALLIHGNNSYTTTCSPTLSVAQSAAGIVTSGLAAFNQIAVSLDNVNATAVQGASAFRVGHAFGGSNTLGNRTAHSVQLIQTAKTGNPRVDGRFYTALGARASTSVNDNGDGSTAGGNLFGSNIIAGLDTGATFWNSLVGMEIDTSAATGTSVLYKIGLQIVNFVGDAVAGSLGVDNALQFAGANSGSSPGWNILISVGAYNGWYPLAATGTVIGTTATSLALPVGPAYAAAYGIDFSAITFSAAFLKSTGFVVDGSGNTTAPSYSVGVGGPTWTSGSGVPGSTQPKGSLYTSHWRRRWDNSLRQPGRWDVEPGGWRMTYFGPESGGMTLREIAGAQKHMDMQPIDPNKPSLPQRSLRRSGTLYLQQRQANSCSPPLRSSTN